MSNCGRRRRRPGTHGSSASSVAASSDFKEDDPFHLPGFYYDASQKRYFRLTPGQNRHNPLTMASIAAKHAEKKCREVVEASLRRSVALPRSLSRVQTGQMRCDSLAASVSRARLASLKSTSQVRVDCGEECTFLSGGQIPGIVVGSWASQTEVDGRRGSVLRSVVTDPLASAGVRTIATHVAHKVVDISVCRRADGTAHALYACVPSDCTSRTTSFVESRTLEGEGTAKTWDFGSEALRSCASVAGGQIHAVGLERKVRLLRVPGTESSSEVWTHREQPLSLEWDNGGSLLLIGTHRGNMFCADLRDHPESKHAYAIPLGRGLVSLKLINGGSRLLASAYDGKLVLVDLRGQKIVQEFRDHCNNGLKTQLSYGEADRIVCSAGDDRVVRLWQVGEDEPLAAFRPGSGHHQPWPWYSTALFCAAGDECFSFR